MVLNHCLELSRGRKGSDEIFVTQPELSLAFSYTRKSHKKDNPFNNSEKHIKAQTLCGPLVHGRCHWFPISLWFAHATGYQLHGQPEMDRPEITLQSDWDRFCFSFCLKNLASHIYALAGQSVPGKKNAPMSASCCSKVLRGIWLDMDLLQHKLLF